jgi:hypothetical protein
MLWQEALMAYGHALMAYGHARMGLSRENLAEAKSDLQKLRNPGYGGFNLLYGDGYFAVSLKRKWGDLNELDERIKAMEAEAASTGGAGI